MTHVLFFALEWPSCSCSARWLSRKHIWSSFHPGTLASWWWAESLFAQLRGGKNGRVGCGRDCWVPQQSVLDYSSDWFHRTELCRWTVNLIFFPIPFMFCLDFQRLVMLQSFRPSVIWQHSVLIYPFYRSFIVTSPIYWFLKIGCRCPSDRVNAMFIRQVSMFISFYFSFWRWRRKQVILYRNPSSLQGFGEFFWLTQSNSVTR